MLKNSLTVPTGGYHVEQVEIILEQTRSVREVAAAWADTVAATEALRTGFRFPNGIHPVYHAACPIDCVWLNHSSPHKYASTKHKDSSLGHGCISNGAFRLRL